MTRAAVVVSAVVAATIAASGCGRAPANSQPVSMSDEAYAASVNTWRAEHEASYRRGYVTIAGLHELKEGANSAGSARTNDVVLPASVPATIGRPLANEQIYPELIQQEATAERIAEEALNLLNDGSRRSAIKTKLRTVVQSLGPPGASFRAAQAIVNLLVEQGTVKQLPSSE